MGSDCLIRQAAPRSRSGDRKLGDFPGEADDQSGLTPLVGTRKSKKEDAHDKGREDIGTGSERGKAGGLPAVYRPRGLTPVPDARRSVGRSVPSMVAVVSAAVHRLPACHLIRRQDLAQLL